MAKYQVVKECEYSKNVIARGDDYDQIFERACDVAKEYSSSEFHSEIPTAIEERGYYMCGWSSTKIILEEIG